MRLRQGARREPRPFFVRAVLEVQRRWGAAMRQLYSCLMLLVCAVVVLGVGSLLPRLVFSGEGVRGYSAEKRTFAEFALVYDSDLKE